MGATGCLAPPPGALAFCGEPLPGDELLVRLACSSGPPVAPGTAALGGLDWGLALLLVRSRGWANAASVGACPEALASC